MIVWNIDVVELILLLAAGVFAAVALVMWVIEEVKAKKMWKRFKNKGGDAD